MHHYKCIFFTICILIYGQQIFGQKTFELEKVESNCLYYNFIESNNTLYIGTSIGALKISKNNQTSTEKDLIGYLGLENNEISSKGINFGHIIDPKEECKYNYLLPDEYKNLISRNIIYNNKLYIINSNKLFVFVKRNYFITHDSLSVRSITQKYIGSYSGIFKDGLKLPFPGYTDGHIREFENETFICYEGLFRDSSGIISNYFNPRDKTVLFNNLNLGSARDIIKIEKNRYVLLTTTGIYLVNFSKNQVEIIYKSQNNTDKLTIVKNEIINNKNNRLFFSVNDKIKYFIYESKETFTLIDTKGLQINQAIFPNTIDRIYVLLNNRFSEYILQAKTNKYIENVLFSNLKLTHNFVIKEDNIIISSNEGIHLYNLKTNKQFINVIPIETNNLSLSIVNDTVKVGSINGIINITQENINDLIKEYIDRHEKENEGTDNKFFFFILLQGIVILFLSLLVFKQKQKNKVILDKSINETRIATKENIISYIHSNIITVSNKGICNYFNITPMKLYEIFEDEKPGEIIREIRISLVKKYRKEKRDEKFISENTGFSISYLKKIY